MLFATKEITNLRKRGVNFYIQKNHFTFTINSSGCCICHYKTRWSETKEYCFDKDKDGN